MKTTPGMFAAVLSELLAMLTKKNAEYEDVYAVDGIKGVFADLRGKYARLQHLIIKEPGNVVAIRDAFLDMAGYGVLGVILCDHPEIAEAWQKDFEQLGPEIFKGFKQGPLD